MTDEAVPDLGAFWLHRVQEEAAFEGVRVPGLVARFYRRDDGGRLASMGQYLYRGRELLRAWGFVDEQHCRFSAVRGPDGVWGTVTVGCPQVQVLRDGDEVTGFLVRAADGSWYDGRQAPALRVGPRSGECATAGMR